MIKVVRMFQRMMVDFSKWRGWEWSCRARGLVMDNQYGLLFQWQITHLLCTEVNKC